MEGGENFEKKTKKIFFLKHDVNHIHLQIPLKEGFGIPSHLAERKNNLRGQPRRKGVWVVGWGCVDHGRGHG